MKYKEARAYRERIEKRGMVLGLKPMRRLLGELGNPQEQLQFIHVAGTNGKGSVLAFLEEILQRSGYRTGMYSSPAVYHPLEVFRANGRSMDEETYGELMGKLQGALKVLEKEQVFPTVYEVETAMAFLYFLQENCQVVLLETGLGGAMDATNCIEKPQCVVFTHVGYDHMGVLGDALEDIGRQKAGIVKEGSVVVSAPQEECVLAVFRQVCLTQSASLTVADAKQIHVQSHETADKAGRLIVQYKSYPPMELGLLGRFQAENAVIVLEVVEKLRDLGYNIPIQCVMEGIAGARWKGRLTVVSRMPYILLDGAHNVPAAQELARTLREDFADRKWVFLVGVLRDKDYKGIVRTIAPLAKKVVTITPSGHRALKGECLAQEFRAQGYDACYGGSMENAIALCRNACQGRTDMGILAFGSLTFHQAFMEALGTCMFRVERLLYNGQFQELMGELEELERNRVFCRHGWEHCMAVARAAALLNEERCLGYSREMLYALALVHDIGRVQQYKDGTPHEEAGARIAGELLPLCGFEAGEVKKMVDAILEHRSDREGENGLSQLLMEADKRTRLCFACGVRESCNWQAQRQNFTIHI